MLTGMHVISLQAASADTPVCPPTTCTESDGVYLTIQLVHTIVEPAHHGAPGRPVAIALTLNVVNDSREAWDLGFESFYALDGQDQRQDTSDPLPDYGTNCIDNSFSFMNTTILPGQTWTPAGLLCYPMNSVKFVQSITPDSSSIPLDISSCTPSGCPVATTSTTSTTAQPSGSSSPSAPNSGDGCPLGAVTANPEWVDKINDDIHKEGIIPVPLAMIELPKGLLASVQPSFNFADVQICATGIVAAVENPPILTAGQGLSIDTGSAGNFTYSIDDSQWRHDRSTDGNPLTFSVSASFKGPHIDLSKGESPIVLGELDLGPTPAGINLLDSGGQVFGADFGPVLALELVVGRQNLIEEFAKDESETGNTQTAEAELSTEIADDAAIADAAEGSIFNGSPPAIFSDVQSELPEQLSETFNVWLSGLNSATPQAEADLQMLREEDVVPTNLSGNGIDAILGGDELSGGVVTCAFEIAVTELPICAP